MNLVTTYFNRIQELEKENEKLWEKLRIEACSQRMSHGFCSNKCETCIIGTIEKFKEWEREE